MNATTTKVALAASAIMAIMESGCNKEPAHFIFPPDQTRPYLTVHRSLDGAVQDDGLGVAMKFADGESMYMLKSAGHIRFAPDVLAAGGGDLLQFEYFGGGIDSSLTGNSLDSVRVSVEDTNYQEYFLDKMVQEHKKSTK